MYIFEESPFLRAFFFYAYAIAKKGFLGYNKSRKKNKFYKELKNENFSNRNFL